MSVVDACCDAFIPRDRKITDSYFEGKKTRSSPTSDRRSAAARAQKSHPPVPPARDRSNRRAARTKLLRRRSSPRDPARRCTSPFTKGAPLRHPLFTCWPYANSRIRDRTRPTAIGIQIQISHCEGYPRPLQVLRLCSRRSRRNPRTLVTPFAGRIPVLRSERPGKRERATERSERRHNNNNAWARRGPVSGPETATIGKFEVDDQPSKPTIDTAGRDSCLVKLEPSHPSLPLALAPHPIARSLFTTAFSPSRSCHSLEITRPWKKNPGTRGISMRTCERVSGAHHLSVFHPRFPQPGRSLIPGIVARGPRQIYPAGANSVIRRCARRGPPGERTRGSSRAMLN